MTNQDKGKSKPSEQFQGFIETARQLGVDEESSAADALMGRLAKMPPDPKRPPKLSKSSRVSKASR